MILPRGEMLAVILPFVIVPPVDSGSILIVGLVDDKSWAGFKAQSCSEGSWRWCVARTRRAFGPHGSMKTFSKSYWYTRRLFCVSWESIVTASELEYDFSASVSDQYWEMRKLDFHGLMMFVSSIPLNGDLVLSGVINLPEIDQTHCIFMRSYRALRGSCLVLVWWRGIDYDPLNTWRIGQTYGQVRRPWCSIRPAGGDWSPFNPMEIVSLFVEFRLISLVICVGRAYEWMPTGELPNVETA